MNLPNQSRRTLRLVVEYDGTDFCGWQRQNDVRTVQETIEQAFEVMLKHPVSVRGAGRTDAGVHALGQVAAIDIDEDIPTHGFIRGLNALLPHDVAIIEVTDVPFGFDPRRAARGKIYRYSIWNHPVRSAIHLRSAWHIKPILDLHLMRQAAKQLEGEHDFRAFRAADCERPSTRRLMRRVDVQKQGAMITIEVEGTAFLKNMVRIMAGTLVGAGLGKIPSAQIDEALVFGQRTMAGVTAPPQGLAMVHVIY
jgi:tRNA pseudouridine38-40 synthase